MKLVFCLWLALPSFKGAAYVFENIATKYIKIENIEENPERDFVEEKKEKEDTKKKQKEDMKKKDDQDEDDEDEDEDSEEDDYEDMIKGDQKKVFRAWKLVDDYIEKNGADSLEKIVKAGLQGNMKHKTL